MTDDKRLLSIREFCHRYGIGRTTAYSEMAEGRLVYCQVGRRRLIRLDDAEAWALSIRQPSRLVAAGSRT
jgi:excisionase family DNA binding protein